MHDATHVIDWNVIQVKPEGEFHVGPEHIIDRRKILLRNCTIIQVKVQWKHLIPKEATWELENDAWEAYPTLFQDEEMDE